MTTFQNIYDDAAYADAYADLDWDGTYHLVRRDLPDILREHVAGRRALDFGCGTGRSTRLLRDCGFEVTGVDVSASMIQRARQRDPGTDYRLLADGDLGRLPTASFDLVLAAFPFDNVPAGNKPPLFRALHDLLGPTGRLVNVVSAPEIYWHEWASFTTREFPANRHASDGEIVRIVTTGFRQRLPCEDVLCTDAAYRQIYAEAGLAVAAVYRPLARGDEGVAWVSETRVAPWVVWVLRDDPAGRASV